MIVEELVPEELFGCDPTLGCGSLIWQPVGARQHPGAVAFRVVDNGREIAVYDSVTRANDLVGTLRSQSEKMAEKLEMLERFSIIVFVIIALFCGGCASQGTSTDIVDSGRIIVERFEGEHPSTVFRFEYQIDRRILR